MSGNVFEWVTDQYHDSYTGAPSDGSAWSDLWFGDRVRRSGCFSSGAAAAVRASFRAPGDIAQGTDYILGIRCAR